MSEATGELEQRVLDFASLVEPVNESFAETAWARLDSLTKPPRSLGRLEELAARVATVQRNDHPDVTTKAVVLMAADHGVVAQGVSPYPQDVTVQMLANFAAGGAAINQLANHAGALLIVIDMGVAADTSGMDGVVQGKTRLGTDDMTLGPAMSREDAAAAILVGIEIAQTMARTGIALIGTGEMGIGNSTAAAAATAALRGVDPTDVVGPGTGLDAEGVTRKADVVRRALEVNAPSADDSLGVLASVGGLELAGMAGLLIGAALARVCVVADGFISGAAALAAVTLCPSVAGYLFPSHRSAEPGHSLVLGALGLKPVLDLDMRLGEGTGAALAMEVIDAACTVMSGMSTFEEAGVSDRAEDAAPE